jgi:hypothetical protein
MCVLVSVAMLIRMTCKKGNRNHSFLISEYVNTLILRNKYIFFRDGTKVAFIFFNTGVYVTFAGFSLIS